MEKKKKIFFQGSWDIINAGHVRAIKLAKSYGDILVIGINTDDLIRRDKKREPILPYNQRKEIIEAIKWVDSVIPCDQENALPYLKMLDADVFVLTREWEERHKHAGIQWIRDKGGKVVFSIRWKDIFCSSDIRKRIKDAS